METGTTVKFSPDTPQRVVVKGYDWGMGLCTAILTLEQPAAPEAVNAGIFEQVVEERESFDWATFQPEHIVIRVPRTVQDAYVCDPDGARSIQPDRYVRVEFACTPATTPDCFDLHKQRSSWCDPYRLLYTVNGETFAPPVDLNHARLPQLEPFCMEESFTGSEGRTLKYAYYEPEEAKAAPEKKLPLVIWLHGAGEGGTNTSQPLLGNKATALASPEFQQAMGGAAYLLLPQTNGFWMEYDAPDTWAQNPGRPSVYTRTLSELIDAFLAAHPAADADRILLCGCSNGGYMSLNMALQYPERFAAVVPICEAYRDAGISDAELVRVKDLPLWFVYAKNDDVVPPEQYEEPTIARLHAMGADLRVSVFEDVHDRYGMTDPKTGAPWQFSGHWSWVYFFNNACIDPVSGEHIWSWMGRQKR